MPRESGAKAVFSASVPGGSSSPLLTVGRTVRDGGGGAGLESRACLYVRFEAPVELKSRGIKETIVGYKDKVWQ